MRFPLAILLLISSAAQAETVIYQFNGVIDTASPNAVNLTTLSAGNSWSATITIDYAESNAGSYNEAIFGNAITELTIDGFGTATYLRSDITFVNQEYSEDYNPSGSIYDAVRFNADLGRNHYLADENQQIDGLYLGELYLNLTDLSDTLFSNNCCGSSDDFVLPGFTNLDQFDDQYFSFYLRETTLYENQAGQAGFGGTILNASVSVVPIPAAFWLFGSALVGLGWLRRKQTI